MEIKASQVKELRDMTGVAMMECKKALVECEGDLEKALDLLRSNSALKAEKKAARVAADGVLKIFVGSEYATLIEINSETDFAAKDTNFINFTNDVSDYIAANKISDVSEFSESEIEEKRKALIQTIKKDEPVIEKIISEDLKTEVTTKDEPVVEEVVVKEPLEEVAKVEVAEESSEEQVANKEEK